MGEMAVSVVSSKTSCFCIVIVSGHKGSASTFALPGGFMLLTMQSYEILGNKKIT
jgi:hypothetical protein